MGGTICVGKRKEEQISKAILWLPYWYVDRFLAAVDWAENILGHPPNIVEIFTALEHSGNNPIKGLYECAAILTSL